ncbi:MAG TPA: serine/threonine-protein kinase, partial [Luteolibacter sp.]|nr:serine/threonine-protein kinase [Luteolibacter sp.]
MPDQPERTRPPALQGLDPDLLLGVLDNDIMDSPPQIPGWRILGVAGTGGSGIVWRARREADDAAAAIKIAPPDEPDTVERIEREATFLRELRHPHVVRLLDAGMIDDGPEAGGLFMAMEFIDGPSLQHRIPENGLPPGKALGYFRQIAEAVAHAHDCGILHRDLKPGNVLIAPDGSVKVADFGLARPVFRRIHQLSLTLAGLVAGTAEYLPPEAYRRDYEPSQGGDIFALGVMLHEMLTGTPPRGAWKPASSRRGVDLRIDAIIARAMDADPARRWPDARAMLAALDRVLASPPRYAGAPLFTVPVKLADCIWTVLGLIVLLAATSSLLRTNESGIKPPIDLVGDHSPLIGGFLSLYVLLLAAVPLGIWQFFRLWRFRAVPMREALPAPFGIDLGHSRLAAILVAICQWFCLWLPVLLLVKLFLDSGMRWLQQHDPPWVHGLAITRNESMSILSPWKPVFTSENLWLWESIGPPGYALSQRIDSISFTPFFTPLLMSLAGTLLVACLAATLWIAIRQWHYSGYRFLPLAATSGSLAMTALICTAAWQAKHESVRSRNPENDKWVVNARMTSHIRDFGKFAIGASRNFISPVADGGWTALYAETVDWRGQPGVDRRDIPTLLADSRLMTDVVRVRVSRYQQSWDPVTGEFTMRVLAVESYDGLEGTGVC